MLWSAIRSLTGRPLCALPSADFVEAALVAQADLAGGVDLVLADTEVGGGAAPAGLAFTRAL